MKTDDLEWALELTFTGIHIWKRHSFTSFVLGGHMKGIGSYIHRLRAGIYQFLALRDKNRGRNKEYSRLTCVTGNQQD